MKRFVAVICAALVASSAAFSIGAGIYDTTGPAADVNMMGYALLTQVTGGIHQRTYARAYVIVDEDTGKRVAFVSSDMGMSSQYVKDHVVARLSELYGDMYTHENVAISGTHTHSAPAGFLEYTLFQITSLGFVNETAQAFVDGITYAIMRAHENVQPASIKYAHGYVDDANINRSPTAYANNPAEERAKYQYNTDHDMWLLRFDGSDGTPIGMVNWFPVHGTSMNNTNKLISSDNKGVASTMFEAEMNGGALPGRGRFVGAFAQSNLGDVSPNVNGTFCRDTGLSCDNAHSTCNGKNEQCSGRGPGKDMFESTHIIGTRQYNVAKNLYANASTDIVGKVDYRHAYVDMSTLEVTYGGRNGSGCSPSMGYAFAAGTTDGPGAFNFVQGDTKSNPFWNAVRDLIATPTKEQIACQAPKPILLPTGDVKIPYDWDPKIVPIQMFQVGQFVIIVVPGEFTTMAGRRLRDAVTAAFAAEGQNVISVIAGLSNTYASYITTYEEFQIQRYEGASTIFGPYEHDGYMQEFTKMATALATGAPVAAGPSPPDLSSKQLSFLPGVVVDSVPKGKSFGEVTVQPKATYTAGERVNVTFYSSCPRNNLMTYKTFLAVEREANGDWVTVVDDSVFETRFYWFRDEILSATSYATITWDIPAGTAPGTYRIQHFNYRKTLLGPTEPFSGTTNTFQVTA